MVGGGGGWLRRDKPPEDWPTCAIADDANVNVKTAAAALSFFFMDRSPECCARNVQTILSQMQEFGDGMPISQGANMYPVTEFPYCLPRPAFGPV